MKYLSLMERVRECFSLCWDEMRFTSSLDCILFSAHTHIYTNAHCTHLMNSNAVDFALILIESLPHSVRSVLSSYCYFNYNYSGTSDRIARKGKCNFHGKIDFHSFALIFFSLALQSFRMLHLLLTEQVQAQATNEADEPN